MDFFKPIRTWKRTSVIRTELYRRSDRQLSDLGIKREDIPTFARSACRK